MAVGTVRFTVTKTVADKLQPLEVWVAVSV